MAFPLGSSEKPRQRMRVVGAAILALAIAHTATAQTLLVWGVPTQVINAGSTNPLSVTVDSRGNIIYTDTGNAHIDVIKADGTTIPPAGAGGACGNALPFQQPVATPPPIDCFGQPTAVAVDSSDLIYVTDYGNNRVIVLDSVNSTTPLRPLISFGTRGGPHGTGMVWIPDETGDIGAPDQFDGPYAIDIDRGAARSAPGVNHVYVLDLFNNRIGAWDCDQSQIRAQSPTACSPNTALSFGNNGFLSDPPPPYFNNPNGFGVDQATGDIGVAETRTLTVDLFRYPFTGPNWGWVGTVGSAYDNAGAGDLGKFSDPIDVKFDAAGNLWVVDQSNNRIQIFSQSPRSGSSPVTFSLIYQPMDGANLVGPDGIDLDLSSPQTVALDPARHRFIVTDEANNRLEIWQPASLTSTLTFDNPAPLSGLPTTATLTITNTGAVPLTNIRAAISTTAGLTLSAPPFTLPPTTLPACEPPTSCPSVSFPVLFNVNGISAVTARADVTGDHEFSGARIVAPLASATVTPSSPATGIGITAVSVTPNPVQSGGTVTLSVTVQNTGQAQVTSTSIAIVPTGAACQSCTAATVPTLAPGASFTWSNLRYTAAASGVVSFAVTASGTAQPSGTAVTAIGSGSTEIRTDTTVPVTTVSYSSPYQSGPNANGFWNAALTVKFKATDPDGIVRICYAITPQRPGIDSKCVDSGVTPAPKSFETTVPIGYDGVYNFTFYAVDSSGNSGASAPGVSLLKLDQTPPVVFFSTPSPLPNSHGWYKGPMTWTVAASDNLSGVQSVTFGGAPLTTSTIALETQGTCVQGTVVATDKAGISSVQSTPCTNIDSANPTITPLAVNGMVTFPVASTSYPNGIGDPAPPAVTPPPGVSVGPYQSSGVDPSTLPPVEGIPIASGMISWTLCDLAGNCYQAFFSAETVNQFDLVNHVDALYARYGPTGYVPTPLVPKPPTHNRTRSHRWGGSGQWQGHGDDRWDDDDHDDRDDCDITTYDLLDANGNGIVMIEHIQKSSGTEVHVGVVTFYYVKGCPLKCVKTAGVVPRGTTKNFEWSLDRKTGAYKEFEQEFTIGRGERRIKVHAKYDSKRNQTTIRREGRKRLDVTLPGLVLLDMATKDGEIFIEYNGNRVTN